MRIRVVLLFLLVACQSNEADRPELLTRSAQIIGATSTLLEGELTEAGPVRPVTVGFLWDTNQDLNMGTAANRYIFGSTDAPRVFSIQIDNLSPATTYYYRSFGATGNFSQVYYGQVVSFTTLP